MGASDPAAPSRRRIAPAWDRLGRGALALPLIVTATGLAAGLLPGLRSGDAPPAHLALMGSLCLLLGGAGLAALLGRFLPAFLAHAAALALLLGPAAGGDAVPWEAASHLVPCLWIGGRALPTRLRPIPLRWALTVLLAACVAAQVPSLAAFLGAGLGRALAPGMGETTPVSIGDSLPDLGFRGPEGSLRVDPRDGRVHVLVFWATWCPPCLRELPEVAALARRWRSEPRIRFLAVCSESIRPEAAGAALKRIGAERLPWAMDTADLHGRLGFRSLPLTLVVHEGRVVKIQLGERPGGLEELEILLRALVARTGDPRAPSVRSEGEAGP